MKKLSLILGLFIPCLLAAQSLQFRHFTTEDGLPHNVGFDIHQDREGLVWIGTDEGLSAFDGKKFRNLSVEDGLNASSIITLWEEPGAEGSLMMGPHRKGVNRLIGDSLIALDFNHIPLWNPRPYYLGNGTILSADLHPSTWKFLFTYIEREGPNRWVPKQLVTVWENNQLLLKPHAFGDRIISPQSRQFFQVEDASMPYINCQLFQDQEGRVYLYNEKGIWQLDPTDMTLHPAFVGQLPRKLYHTAYQDGVGHAWWVGDEYLYKVDLAGQTEKFKIPSEVGAIYEIRVLDETEIFFLEADRKHLHYWNIKTGEQVAVEKLINLEASISFIELDREGNLWLTTMGDGVFMIFGHPFWNHRFTNQAERSFINDIKEDGAGTVWLASRNGISLYDKRGDWELLRVNRGIEVHELEYQTQNDGMYAYLTNGLWLYQKGIEKYQFCRGDIFRGLDLDGEGRLVIGKSIAVNGEPEKYLEWIDPGTCEVVEVQLLDADPKEEIQTKSRTEFITMSPDTQFFRINGGVYLWANNCCEMQWLGREAGLPSDLTNLLVKGPKGKLWVATEKGIAYYHPNGEQAFQLWPYLKGKKCRSLCFDHRGEMWIGTPQGLYHWNGLAMRQYGTQSGLIANDINCLYEDKQHRLWIGTSKGVGRLDLTMEIGASSTPRLLSDGFWVDGVKVPVNSEWVLKEQSRIEWRFVGRNYRTPDAVNYRYRLNPDDEWEFTDNNTLQFTNLAPGDYQASVQARVNNSEWSEPLHRNFTVLTPWWKRVWVILLFILGIGGLLVAFFLRRIRQIRVREQEKVAQSRAIAELELKALQAQINPHFVFNALNAIQSFILDNDTTASHIYLTRFARLMRLFLESSRKSEHELSEEVEMLRLYIEMEQLCYEDRFDYEIEVDPFLIEDRVMIPSMLLQPFVENAIRHGLLHKETKGKLSLQFSRYKESLLCTIIDNGVGVERSKTMEHNTTRTFVSRGMQIVNERIQLQEYLVDSPIQIEIAEWQPDHPLEPGTEVSIRLPYRTL